MVWYGHSHMIQASCYHMHVQADKIGFRQASSAGNDDFLGTQKQIGFS